MNRLMKSILEKIVVIAAGRNIIAVESLYRFSARRYRVEFIGLVEKHHLALFQDPVTGSSFAVKKGEPVESGLRRVRARFGVKG